MICQEMMKMEVKIRDIIATHFFPTFNSKKTNQIYKGGRNSTKSSMIAIKIVNTWLEYDNCSAVILRNHKIDLRKSVYKEIKRACKRLKLIEGIDYKATVAPMEIKFNNGNTIYFAGGEDFEAVKGTIDEDKLIKIVWFEELTGFKDEETVEQIKATFLRGNNDWFMALYSYNPPKNKFHWVNKWVETKQGLKDWLIHHSDYRTVNPEWVGRIAIQEAETLKINDEKRYRWIYLGEVIGLEGLILNPDNISHLNGFASIWCSIENIFLAATAEGYGCTLRVPLGNEGEYARNFLGFPHDYFMPCFIGIGKPQKDAAKVQQKNIVLKDRIHWNKW